MNQDGLKGFRPGVRTLINQKSSTLLEFVAEEIAKEPPTLQLGVLDLIELGSVYVNEIRTLNPNRRLKPGDTVRIHSSPRRFSPPADLPARMIAETDDYLLLDKPAGLPVEPLVDNVKENLISFLEDLRGQRFFLVHRLSPESEGLLVVAKSQVAAAHISRAFAEGRVKRIYAAYVETPVTSGPDESIRILSTNELKAETNVLSENRTTWNIIGEPISVAYRLEVEFMNARPKDVRAYLASQGAPIIGDHLHGSQRKLIDASTGKPAMAFKAISLTIGPVRRQIK